MGGESQSVEPLITGGIECVSVSESVFLGTYITMTLLRPETCLIGTHAHLHHDSRREGRPRLSAQ